MKTYIFSFLLVSFLACSGNKAEQKTAEVSKADSPKVAATTTAEKKPEAATMALFFETRQNELKADGKTITKVLVNDAQNGYMRYAFTEEGNTPREEEMAYFVCGNGQSFVSIVNYMLAENKKINFNDITPHFYGLVAGKLEDQTNTYLPEIESGKAMQTYDPGTGMIMGFIGLPQKGTDIFLAQWSNGLLKRGVLKFDENKCQFKFVK